MSLNIDDVQVFDVDAGGIIRTRMSIVDRLNVSFPATLTWEVSFDWSKPDRSTITCTAEVLDPSGAVVADSGTPAWKMAPGATHGDVTLPITPFRVTVTGTYVVRLIVDGSPRWSTKLLVSG